MIICQPAMKSATFFMAFCFTLFRSGGMGKALRLAPFPKPHPDLLGFGAR